MIFGVGGAFILDEFALSFHLRDVYWTEEGRRSIDASIMWLLLGLLLLVGISPFGIHDQTVVPRTIGVVIVAINIVLSLITCLKGKLTLGLLSVFVPPVGLVTAIRLRAPARSGRSCSTRRAAASSRRHRRVSTRTNRVSSTCASRCSTSSPAPRARTRFPRDSDRSYGRAHSRSAPRRAPGSSRGRRRGHPRPAESAARRRGGGIGETEL